MKSSRLLLLVGSGFLVACGGDASLGKNATDVAGEKQGARSPEQEGRPAPRVGRGPARRALQE